MSYLDYLNTAWIYWTVMIIYFITILSTVGVVISENRNPVKSLAWVTILLVVPVVGLILYFLFGRSIKNKRFIKRSDRRKLKRHESARAFNAAESGLSNESVSLVKLGQSLMSAPYYDANEIEIFTNGLDKFKRLIADILAAKHYIYLQYYIFSDDRIGREIADALITKASEGVKIKVIYDHVGSLKTSRRFFKRLAAAGIEIHPFFKVSLPFLGSRINWRNHRKITVIDGKVGYIGGMNIADRYVYGEDGKRPWRDTHARVSGLILRSLIHSFSTDWILVGQDVPDDDKQNPPVASKSKIGMQMVTGGPNSQWSNISLIMLKAIGNAKHSVFIQTPYFLPTESLLRMLQAAALAKIDVRILIPRKADSMLLRYASYSYIKECLRSGIKFYLYEPGMIHSKVMIVDDEFVTLGSTNFDFRSFEHNFESNLFIYSKPFNKTMREMFMADLENSTRILPYEWDKRPFSSKLKESITRPLAPIL